MTEKNSRAQRRADYARLKKNRQFHWGYGHVSEWAGRTPDCAGEINYMSPCTAGIVVNTPTPCSCYMCGNPRRKKNSWGESTLTMQELKAYNAFEDGIEEYDQWTNPRDCWLSEWHSDYDHYDEDYYYEQEEKITSDWYLRWMYYRNP